MLQKAFEWKIHGLINHEVANKAKADTDFVPCENSSTMQRYYIWKDKLPLPGTSYCRLKVMDKGSTYRYSNVRSVAFRENTVYLELTTSLAQFPTESIYIINNGKKNTLSRSLKSNERRIDQ